MTNTPNHNKDRALKWFRKYHKWPSLIFTFFIFLFSISGIILNHRKQFSGVDVNRKLLPANYRYHNWNLGAIKSHISISTDSVLIYGNIGIWKTDIGYKSFTSFNQGFPKGIDNRKITSMIKTRNGRLFAGTLFGLYEYNSAWERIKLPVSEDRIVKVLEKGDSLFVMTRSNLLVTNINQKILDFRTITIPVGNDYDNKTGLFKTLWVIHSGEIYGKAGRLLVDLVGLIVMVICITGLFYWLAPHLLKRISKPAGSRVKKINKFSLKWHNRIGSWAILLLLLTTITGMFLRPPLLIPIANTKVAKIKYSELDNPNPWHDRLRDLLYDKDLNRFIIASSEGLYYTDDSFGSALQKFRLQPPVSVMGITVLESISTGDYLIGSFSGIFRWIPEQGIIEDYITLLPASIGAGGPPFGTTAVSGYIRQSSDKGIIFDYGQGAIEGEHTRSISEMPVEIIKESPLSLWNTALEVHTGRIYEFLIGKFYILIVPLTGLAMLLILVTGFFAWWIPYRRKRKSAPSPENHTP